MNISTNQDCYGCGVCAIVCPQKIISLNYNKLGFLEPKIIDEVKCTNCSICSKVCSFNDVTLSNKAQEINIAYAAWSKDSKARKDCSSGGVSIDISKYLFTLGYKICSVRYNPDKNIAEHYLSSNKTELKDSYGSKYIQSYSVDGFSACTNEGKYMVIGTPCQIASFRKYVKLKKKEQDYVLVDFFCHGVPSKLMWNKYYDYLKQLCGNISSISWRNKDNGWHDSWLMKCNGDISNFEKAWTKGDMFYTLFLTDSCLGKACYDNCKFKYKNSSADIRLGDAWGKLYANNEKGVSIAVPFTTLGEQILQSCGCVLVKHEFDKLAELQLQTNPSRPAIYSKITAALVKENTTIIDIYGIVIKERIRQKLLSRLRNPQRTIINFCKRIIKQ